VQRLTLDPLESIVKAIEKHASIISNWEFEKPVAVPAFRLSDIAASVAA
jgi:hypothetical protein